MKYWEAEVKGITFTSPTLKGLALKLNIKPCQIEGVYYRKRLSDLIKIRKVIIEPEKPVFSADLSGNFFVCFD